MTQKLTINLNGEFSAEELDEIIRELAEQRATLLPAVLATPPGDDVKVLDQREPAFRIRSLVDGGLRIWLRNEGLGWMVFQLSADVKDQLTDFLSNKLGHTHTFH